MHIIKCVFNSEEKRWGMKGSIINSQIYTSNENTFKIEIGYLVPWTSCTGNLLLSGIRILSPLLQHHSDTPDLSWKQMPSILSEQHPQRMSRP